MIITNSRYALVGYFITSYPTRAHGIIVIYTLYIGTFVNENLAVKIYFEREVNAFVKTKKKIYRFVKISPNAQPKLHKIEAND